MARTLPPARAGRLPVAGVHRDAIDPRLGLARTCASVKSTRVHRVWRHAAARCDASAVRGLDPKLVELARELDRTERALCTGDLAEVVRSAARARVACREAGLRDLEARAGLLLAAGHLGLGQADDLIVADQALASACALLAETRPRRSLEFAVLLRAALGARRAEPALGVTALVAASPPPRVLVDVDRGAIAGPRGAVTGRYRLCAILQALLDGDGRPVAAEPLYVHAWGAAAYHPLRHRGTLYSAVNRVRQVLRLVDDDASGELIETTPSGWRLVRGVVGSAPARMPDDGSSR
jgi:hypothetical protein